MNETTTDSSPPAGADIPRRMSFVPRLTISLVAGLFVLGVVTSSAFQQYRGWVDMDIHKATLRYIAKVEAAIEAYREEHRVLPTALSDLPGVSGVLRDSAGRPTDAWGHPLHYRLDGDRYRIVSYNHDGRPGGVGLDYDLSNDNVSVTKDRGYERLLYQLPPQSRATFRQFVTDRGDYTRARWAEGDPYHGSGGMMALMSLLSGATAFALAFRVLRGAAKDSRRSVSLFSELLATVVITLIGGTAIAWFHLPTGH